LATERRKEANAFPVISKHACHHWSLSPLMAKDGKSLQRNGGEKKEVIYKKVAEREQEKRRVLS